MDIVVHRRRGLYYCCSEFIFLKLTLYVLIESRERESKNIVLLKCWLNYLADMMMMMMIKYVLHRNLIFFLFYIFCLTYIYECNTKFHSNPLVQLAFYCSRRHYIDTPPIFRFKHPSNTQTSDNSLNLQKNFNVLAFFKCLSLTAYTRTKNALSGTYKDT